jgi:hypothetical protein
MTRRISNEQELPVASDLAVEPTILPISNNLLPQAADIACLVVPSRSRTNSLCISQNDGSHSSTDGQNDRQIIL